MDNKQLADLLRRTVVLVDDADADADDGGSLAKHPL